jgi:gamma-glutamyltranspeptidase
MCIRVGVLLIECKMQHGVLNCRCRDPRDGLTSRGHPVSLSPSFDVESGCGQAALRLDNGAYAAASDHRKDGYPVGL